MAAQDMPPVGGFGHIPVSRTFAKPMVRQGIVLFIACNMTLFGVFYLGEFRKRLRILRIEQMEHYIATVPFLYAEQERKYLTNLWNVRERERELMKDVPGWKVGTLYGEEVYKTVPKGYLPVMPATEFSFGRSQYEWTTKVALPDYWL